MKYILVTGGVISGIGKGVIASSIGALLKACNLRVTSIKIDPYINIDAGTFSPYEHGEVYVLDDGGEVDLDLGNYERFLDIRLHRENNITTGKIYQDVIRKERRGEYLGKTVQIVPHVCNAIQDTVQSVARMSVESKDGKEVIPEICIIELGGTIGDIESMPFVEAFRQFQFRVGKENFCSVHVSLVPKTAGEQKTKPTQNSVKALRGEGLAPDVIVCRSEKEITREVREKISYFCHVDPKQVIGMHDVPSIYRVPVALEEQGLVEYFIKRLEIRPQLPINPTGKSLRDWRKLADRYDNVNKEVAIALVGKYTKLEDAYASVVKALKHSCLHLNYGLKLLLIEAADLEEETKSQNPIKYYEAWKQLHEAQGILVPGGFGERGINGKIAAIERARLNQIPFLGVCLGLQCAVVEYCRNVLQLQDANSTETNQEAAHKVVIDMPEHNQGDMGGTMRLGKRTTVFHHKDSIIYKLYGSKDKIEERHRHRYEVNPEYADQLEVAGLRIVARDETGKRMEIIDIKSHPYFVGVQFHPEYLSRPLKPSPPYLGLILAAINKLTTYVRNDCRISPRNFSDLDTESSDEELKKIEVNQAHLTLPTAST